MSEPTPLEIQREFYRPICSDSEVDRIFNVQTAADHLLKLRADTAIDHMRILRVLTSRRHMRPDGWSLTSSFDQRPFESFVSRLPPGARARCETTTAGFVFCNDPNGACTPTAFGNIITISSSLEYFFFFLNLAFMEFGIEIPWEVRLAALRIGLRTMLKTEALDFALDPRGIIPAAIERRNRAYVRRQVQYVIAHEYAHHVLGHLEERRLVDLPLFAAMRGEPEEPKHRFYNLQERQELDADVVALTLPKYTPEERTDAAMAAITWFAYLHVFQQVADQLFPRSPTKVRTHPDPLERLWNVFGEAGAPSGLERSSVDACVELCERFRSDLQDDVAVNTEAYEMYGSIYLGAPNTKWRGRALTDRVDF